MVFVQVDLLISTIWLDIGIRTLGMIVRYDHLEWAKKGVFRMYIYIYVHQLKIYIIGIDLLYKHNWMYSIITVFTVQWWSQILSVLWFSGHENGIGESGYLYTDWIFQIDICIWSGKRRLIVKNSYYWRPTKLG